MFLGARNVKLRGFKWVTPGSVVAVLVWLLASAAFAFYVANFGSYDKTYGTLGGVVVMLIWLWITNLALLFGHELNAERERGLELEEGVPSGRARDPARTALRAQGPTHDLKESQGGEVWPVESPGLAVFVDEQAGHRLCSMCRLEVAFRG